MPYQQGNAVTTNTDPLATTASSELATPPFLTMNAISKSFFGVPALRNVSFDLQSGEVHALIGENGAGKSTLMKILSGSLSPDSGTMELDNETVTFANPRQAQSLGISIIHQELNLFPERTVAQNIFLGREPRSRFNVDIRKMNQDTARLLEIIGASGGVRPDAIVGNLSVAQQQLVEIAKALSFNARVVIMDEPTASLAPAEVQTLFTLVRELQAQGVTFVYISHRLEELLEISQRITVLKDGQLVGTVPTREITAARLVSMMVGREMTSYYPPPRSERATDPPIIDITGAGNASLHSINLAIHPGEIVGMAGLEGSGRTELARAIFGADPFTSGTMRLKGQSVRFRTPREAIRHGIGLLTEDRKSEGLVLIASIKDNGLLTARSVRLPHVNNDAVGDIAGTVDLRAASLEQEARYLSGGNQQKVVLIKWLKTNASLLIFDEPTRGIDVGAKAGIHSLMRELAEQGVAILMISSELPEVIGMADRILVMHQGTIAGELPAGASEDEIMTLAAGQRAGIPA